MLRGLGILGSAPHEGIAMATSCPASALLLQGPQPKAEEHTGKRAAPSEGIKQGHTIRKDVLVRVPELLPWSSRH